MTKSEDIADEYFLKKEGPLWLKNGWPDRWYFDEKTKLLHVREYKYAGQKLTKEQYWIKKFLIEHGVHYQQIEITKKGEVLIVFDSKKHEIY